MFRFMNLSYDRENRLVKMSNANTVRAFTYDYRGRRAEKTETVNGTVRLIYVRSRSRAG